MEIALRVECNQICQVTWTDVSRKRLMREARLITLFKLLLHSSGLSVQEAVSEFKVSEQTIIDWCHGRATPIEKVIQYLFYLVDLQDHAAGWVCSRLWSAPRGSQKRSLEFALRMTSMKPGHSDGRRRRR
jgi:hypothetical protein